MADRDGRPTRRRDLIGWLVVVGATAALGIFFWLRTTDLDRWSGGSLFRTIAYFVIGLVFVLWFTVEMLMLADAAVSGGRFTSKLIRKLARLLRTGRRR